MKMFYELYYRIHIETPGLWEVGNFAQPLNPDTDHLMKMTQLFFPEEVIDLTDVEAMCEWVFHYHNAEERPEWTGEQRGIRTNMCIGDVVVFGETAFAVAEEGFDLVNMSDCIEDGYGSWTADLTPEELKALGPNAVYEAESYRGFLAVVREINSEEK